MIETVALFFRSGGPMMWVILSVLAVAGAVVAERLHFFLRVCRADADELSTRAIRKLAAGDGRGALAAFAESRCPAGAILRQAVRRHADGLRPGDVRLAAEEAAVREMPRYGRRLGDLAMLANVATLAGLLGTIFGLQQAFGSLAVVEAAEKASLLAGGIGQAMNTTAFGLIVAIPCLVAYTRLSSLAARRVEACDAAAIKLLAFVEAERAAERAEPAILPERAAV